MTKEQTIEAHYAETKASYRKIPGKTQSFVIDRTLHTGVSTEVIAHPGDDGNVRYKTVLVPFADEEKKIIASIQKPNRGGTAYDTYNIHHTNQVTDLSWLQTFVGDSEGVHVSGIGDVVSSPINLEVLSPVSHYFGRHGAERAEKSKRNKQFLDYCTHIWEYLTEEERELYTSFGEFVRYTRELNRNEQERTNALFQGERMKVTIMSSMNYLSDRLLALGLGESDIHIIVAHATSQLRKDGVFFENSSINAREHIKQTIQNEYPHYVGFMEEILSLEEILTIIRAHEANITDSDRKWYQYELERQPRKDTNLILTDTDVFDEQALALAPRGKLAERVRRFQVGNVLGSVLYNPTFVTRSSEPVKVDEQRFPALIFDDEYKERVKHLKETEKFIADGRFTAGDELFAYYFRIAPDMSNIDKATLSDLLLFARPLVAPATEMVAFNYKEELYRQKRQYIGAADVMAKLTPKFSPHQEVDFEKLFLENSGMKQNDELYDYIADRLVGNVLNDRDINDPVQLEGLAYQLGVSLDYHRIAIALNKLSSHDSVLALREKNAWGEPELSAFFNAASYWQLAMANYRTYQSREKQVSGYWPSPLGTAEVQDGELPPIGYLPHIIGNEIRYLRKLPDLIKPGAQFEINALARRAKELDAFVTTVLTTRMKEDSKRRGYILTGEESYNDLVTIGLQKLQPRSMIAAVCYRDFGAGLDKLSIEQKYLRAVKKQKEQPDKPLCFWDSAIMTLNSVINRHLQSGDLVKTHIKDFEDTNAPYNFWAMRRSIKGRGSH